MTQKLSEMQVDSKVLPTNSNHLFFLELSILNRNKQKISKKEHKLGTHTYL